MAGSDGPGSSRSAEAGRPMAACLRPGDHDTLNGVKIGGVDGARTRDLRRDRPAF